MIKFHFLLQIQRGQSIHPETNLANRYPHLEKYDLLDHLKCFLKWVVQQFEGSDILHRPATEIIRNIKIMVIGVAVFTVIIFLSVTLLL